MDNRLRRWVGVGGLGLIAVLLVTVFATPSTPDSTASAVKVAVFVHQHRNGLYLNAYLTSLSVLIGAVFLWYLRHVVAPDSPGQRLANLGLAGGLLFLVGGIYSAGAAYAMADVAKHAGPDVLQTLNVFSEDVNSFSGAMAALLIGATSLSILRSKVLSRWFAYIGLVLAVVSFVVPSFGFFGFALWVLVTSIVILVASGKPAVVEVGVADLALREGA
jgi:hypothetical protein